MSVKKVCIVKFLEIILLSTFNFFFAVKAVKKMFVFPQSLSIYSLSLELSFREFSRCLNITMYILNE